MIEGLNHLASDFILPIIVYAAAPGYILFWTIGPIWMLYDFIRFLNWRLRPL